MNNEYPTALQLSVIALGGTSSGAVAIYQFHNQYTLRKATPNSEQRRLCFIASVSSLSIAITGMIYAIVYPIELANGWTSVGKLAPGEWSILDVILGISAQLFAYIAIYFIVLASLHRYHSLCGV